MSRRQASSTGSGRLLLGSASLHTPKMRGSRLKEPLTVGGVACLAKAALEKNMGR